MLVNGSPTNSGATKVVDGVNDLPPLTVDLGDHPTVEIEVGSIVALEEPRVDGSELELIQRLVDSLAGVGNDEHPAVGRLRKRPCTRWQQLQPHRRPFVRSGPRALDATPPGEPFAQLASAYSVRLPKQRRNPGVLTPSKG